METHNIGPSVLNMHHDSPLKFENHHSPNDHKKKKHDQPSDLNLVGSFNHLEKYEFVNGK
jgi:hypothetical protein